MAGFEPTGNGDRFFHCHADSARGRSAAVRALAFSVLILLAGCSSLGVDTSSTRTFNAPMARVKPAMISTLAGMGMRIASLEVRGGREVLKARKADKSVEIEFERLGPAATRVRVTGGNQAAVLRETGKRLGDA